MALKLLFIGNYLKGSGFNRGVWHDTADQLRSTGYEIITTSSQVNKAVRLGDMLWTILNKQKEYQIAQIDVFSGPAFTWAECSAHLLSHLRKPFVLTLHGGNLPSFAQKHPSRVRWVLQAAQKVITPSDYLQSALRDFRDDILVIPNPVDLIRYPSRLRTHPQPRLIWLRAFHEIYNPLLAPRVVKELIEDYPDLHLIMVGPDKGDGSLARMQKEARELSVADRIELPGGVPRSQVLDWLDKGDIFLNTTNYDNTPVSVIEAMACGLNIVSTAVGGIPYLLEHEVDALLVPPDNPLALAAAVRRLLTEPSLAQRLSHNARKKAEGFDWSAVLPQWDALFMDLAKNA